MGNNYIICTFNLFDSEQKIYKIDDNGSQILATVPTEEVGATIAGLCVNQNIYQVHLFGQEDYLSETISKIQTNTYTNKTIEIEVN